MRTTEANQLQSLRDVRSFLDRHRHDVPDIATSGARRRLDDTLDRLHQHIVDQSASDVRSRACTQRYRFLRRRLIRTHMLPIALIARAAEPPVPELDPFRLPRGKPTAHRLAAAAHGMATAAAKHPDVFTAAGLPPDFAGRMMRAADEMLESITEREKERVRHRGATHGLRTKLVSARRVVRVLDAFVATACDGDDALLAAWQSAMHVRRTVRHRVAVLPAGTPSAEVKTGQHYAPNEASTGAMTGPRRPMPMGARVLALFTRPDRAA